MTLDDLEPLLGLRAGFKIKVSPITSQKLVIDFSPSQNCIPL